MRVKGRGWDELLGKRLVEAYLPYISRTQLSSVVAGIAPIRSLLNITSGVGDLIYTPMQQWQKDGRILTGKSACHWLCACAAARKGAADGV